MSQENVEAFKRGIRAANRRDLSALLEVMDPEVEWHPVLQVSVAGEATVYRGHRGIQEMLRDADDVWSELRYELSEIQDLGDRIVAIGNIRARGKESGAVVEVPFGFVVDFNDGKAIRISDYLDPKDALDAAGLRE